MRVGFDTSVLARPCPPGLARVVRESLAELSRRGTIDVVRLDPPDGERLAVWRQSGLPRAVRREGLAGIHSFVSAFALRGPGRRVQTIHELPWKHGTAENADLRHRLWAGPLSLRADAIVTGTRAVARDLGRRLAEDGGKVHVVPWGVGAEFAEEPAPGAVDEVALARYRLPERPLVLCLGAVRAKKNLAAVLRGVARLTERGGPLVHVVVSGADTPDLRRDLGLVARLGMSRQVSTPGVIEEADLPALLRLATVVPVLSRSEGFGLPVLEALACGTPVIVPAGSAQAEVAGEDGFQVDPGDADAVADALARAVEEREELRYVLPERARCFPWSRTAEGIERVWEGLG